jgi:hypothetical protein
MNAIPLSPVDYIFTGAGAQPITFAFSYSDKVDPDRLRDGLNETLAYFPVLRCKLKKITGTDYILNSLKTLENLRKQKGPAAMEEIHLRHPHHGIIVTNLTRLPITDLDFSTGAPVNFSTYAEVTGSAAIFPAENGLEILIVPPTERI